MYKKKRLPAVVSPCPITEAVIEIRFDSKYPDEAVFGIFYKEFSQAFPRLVPNGLPIKNIPEPIRQQDPNLKFRPHYEFKYDDFSIQIGPKVLVLIKNGEYKGWSNFKPHFEKILTIANQGNIFDSITRLGIRYINFLEGNVLDFSDLAVNLDASSLSTQETFFKTVFNSGRFRSLLQLSNDASIKKQGLIQKGSIVDIDTYLEDKIVYSQLNDLLEEGHREEKELFFALLKQEYIDKFLNAKYS